MMKRGDLVRVQRNNAAAQYGVVLAMRIKVVEEPYHLFNQALVHYEDGRRAWSDTKWIFEDRSK